MIHAPRNPARRAAYCAAYKAGEAIPDIARRFNASRQAVYDHLKREGLVGPGRRPANDELEELPAQFVDRDPCPRCGSNPEVFRCHHSRAPLSMGAFA